MNITKKIFFEEPLGIDFFGGNVHIVMSAKLLQFSKDNPDVKCETYKELEELMNDVEVNMNDDELLAFIFKGIPQEYIDNAKFKVQDIGRGAKFIIITLDTNAIQELDKITKEQERKEKQCTIGGFGIFG